MPFYFFPMHEYDTDPTPENSRWGVMKGKDQDEATKEAVEKWAGPWVIHWDEIREATDEEVEEHFRDEKAWRYSMHRDSDLLCDFRDISQNTYEGRDIYPNNHEYYRLEAIRKALKKAFEEGWKIGKSERAHERGYYESDNLFAFFDTYGDHD